LLDAGPKEVVLTDGVTAINGAYVGGVYSPTQDRVYLVPYGQGDQTVWHYINDYDDLAVPISKTLMAGALFNKL
jgi:hypothetical protein